ncbi:MAG: glycoside hydrolase N-terminal domain-containing protein [Puniceicoccales bacterium]|jgi:hypothetical protein|nr:glycoside hydrolase N-terminal domain-containing protein [Puniceicoccales bacterium]
MKPVPPTSLSALASIVAFAVTTAFAPVALSAAPVPAQSAVALAAKHPITADKPCINFFEGAVLGNGALGVVMTTRPDNIAFHFGHNNVWDIRIAEDNKEKLGTFQQLFDRVKALPANATSVNQDKWLRDYIAMSDDNYRKSYPRPFPCGTVQFFFDPTKTELLGHKIDISTGLCEVFFKRVNTGETLQLQVFADMNADALRFRLTGANFFSRVKVIPDSSTPRNFPKHTVTGGGTGNGFTQILPYAENCKTHPKDKAFRLELFLTQTVAGGLHTPLKEGAPLLGCVKLTEGLFTSLASAKTEAPVAAFDTAFAASKNVWREYWEKSSVEFAGDAFLERIWYWNHYFFNCATKAGATCPGLFANWSLGSIGTAWHGDYHMNYNTQQPFWLPFASNRLDKNLPYVSLVHHLLPVSKSWAKNYYKMRGAFFPHSAYPVDMTILPYPVPTWGWEVFETPWTVQGLWWHYLYSQDLQFLKEQAFEPIKAATEFLIDYIKRPDAAPAVFSEITGAPLDDKAHIYPSVPPELYGLRPRFKYNYDTQIDIALTKFLFKAYLQAVRDLGIEDSEKTNVRDVKEILPKLPPYSTVTHPEYGEIYNCVPDEKADVVYNLPANLQHVFPGEDFGIATRETDPATYAKLVNTYKAHHNEGGNDLVTLSMIGARLGILDIERWKRQVNYCMLPNGTASDRVLQGGGRYDDRTNRGFMDPMGIWFENFATPAVINECLLQSYDGILRLFPNWDKKRNAKFTTLRAAGAFLVSSEMRDGQCAGITVYSEKGKTLKILNPWTNQIETFKTRAGETLKLAPPR